MGVGLKDTNGPQHHFRALGDQQNVRSDLHVPCAARGGAQTPQRMARDRLAFHKIRQRATDFIGLWRVMIITVGIVPVVLVGVGVSVRVIAVRAVIVTITVVVAAIIGKGSG